MFDGARYSWAAVFSVTCMEQGRSAPPAAGTTLYVPAGAVGLAELEVQIGGGMATSTPIVLVPGLNCSARIYSNHVAPLWRLGPVTIANHMHGDTIEAIARHVLACAPPRFALVGFSMGGYISFEMIRQAPDRVSKLALLDTSARPDTPEQSERRAERVAMARSGHFSESLDLQYPIVVHHSRRNDHELRFQYRRMAEEYGADAFVRHSVASSLRIDSRPCLAAIRCATLVLVGDSDQLTPPDAAAEMAAKIKSARLVTVSDCGHLSPLERPEAVAEALVAWLNW
jgi:pimeloyl-ACP methyl ester carboxylesterase